MFDRDDGSASHISSLGEGWALEALPPRKPLWGRLKAAWTAFMLRDAHEAEIAEQREARRVAEISALAEENAQLRAKVGLMPWEPFTSAKEDSHV